MSSLPDPPAGSGITALVAELADAEPRGEAATRLAAALGADDLVVFTLDGSVGAWLPAPGFAQASRAALAFARLAERAAAQSEPVAAELSSGQDVPPRPVIGIGAGPGCVVILIGLTEAPALDADARASLRLFARAIVSEHSSRMDRAEAQLARESAQEAHLLASTVDRVRGELERSMQALRQRSRRLSLLTEAALELGREMSVAKVLETLVARAQPVFEAGLVAATLVDTDGHPGEQSLFTTPAGAAWINDGSTWIRDAPRPESGPSIRLCGSEVRDQLGLAVTLRPPGAYLCSPMRARTGELIGYLRIVCADAGAVDADDEAMAVHLGQIGAAAIENALLMRRTMASEQAARAQFDLLHAIASSLAEGVIAFDPAGVITFANAAAGALIGVPDGTLVGRDAHSALHPSCSEPGCPLRLRSEPDLPARRFETRIERSGGASFPAQCSLSLIVAEKTVLGSALAISDVGEHRQLEDQLRRKQKLESIGLLAGGIAHDFNNLLTPILGQASVLREELPDDDPRAERLDDVVGAAQKAADLTRQLLAYAGKGRLIMRPLDLSRAVREVLPLLQSAIPPLVKLELELSDPPCAVTADPGQLHQIVLNLVINAAEAIGGQVPGRITLRTEHVVLGPAELAREALDPVFDVSPGRFALLVVQDTGSGMDAATRDRIFEPFFTTKFTGRGLGLAAVLGIVRSHRGAIQVRSTPGAGTEFRVLLPATDAHVETAPSLQPPLPEGSATILIVEDERAVRRLLRQVLSKHGYRVLEAADGRRGVEIFQATPNVDLVLLDVAMPEMEGEEALSRLRQLRHDCRVIVTSGYHEGEAVDRMTSLRGVSFLAKPLGPRTLLEKVAAALADRTKA